jgi:hypothetical protein
MKRYEAVIGVLFILAAACWMFYSGITGHDVLPALQQSGCPQPAPAK